MADPNQVLFSNLLGLLMSKVIVPSDFHGRVDAVKKMLDDDISGLVDSLTDFAVDTASVDFNIETNNSNLTEALNTWLDTVNIDFDGKIPCGLKALSKEYFKERWKYSSFPVLQVSKWEVDPKTKLMLPSQMYFLDGASIYAKDTNPGSPTLSFDSYDYYLGKALKVKIGKNAIFGKTNGRWHDVYPNPFLIKRGVYHNWRIIEAVKRNELDVLDQVIPYMLLIKKGTERLAIDKNINYDSKKLKEVISQIEELMSKAKSLDSELTKKNKTPVRASQFDEEIQHLIPNLEALFKSELFAVAERNILSGLGFIDVIDAMSSSRRESVLNPKPFVQEVITGVEDFKHMIKQLLYLVVKNNPDSIKYNNVKLEVTSTPIKGFMTDKFKERIRQLWDRGLVSSKTATELIAEIDFDIEVARREKEAKEGTDYVMYPHITDNKESIGMDFSGDSAPAETPDDIPDAQSDPIEKKNFDKSSQTPDEVFANLLDQETTLIGSPYDSIKDLPKQVHEKLPNITAKRKWLKVFNSAYNYYLGKFGDTKRAETLAFATAWAQVKKA